MRRALLVPRSTSRGGVFQSGRWVAFAGAASVLGVVCDGWSGKPSAFLHQIVLLPFGLVFGIVVFRLLRLRATAADATETSSHLPLWWFEILAAFEIAAIALIAAEAHHFRQFGYLLTARTALAAAFVAGVGWLWYWRRRSPAGVFVGIVGTYVAGFGYSIANFPLNYLRSDMLPVIGWADQRLVRHLNPYGTMHVGARAYDFPYLPGMLVAYWPAVALHLDLRIASLLYVLAAVGLTWWEARPERSLEVAASVGVLLLCPFLQYRHELYLQPHWFLVVFAVVLMDRGRFLWAGLVWGASCAVYQFSWVLLPFVLLNGYRRGRLAEAGKVVLAAIVGALLIAGPFLHSAWQRIESNTVGQWSRLPHALADPINVSYWLTYIFRPDQLEWLQAVVLVGLFGYCWFKGRCATLEDTLRWMSVALGVFIPMNVLVDGYFYLTLLLLLLLYLCVANGWWRGAGKADGMNGLARSQDSALAGDVFRLKRR